MGIFANWGIHSYELILAFTGAGSIWGGDNCDDDQDENDDEMSISHVGSLTAPPPPTHLACSGMFWHARLCLFEWISSRPTSIRPELGCEADLGCSKVRQRFCRHPRWTSLAADRKTHPVQNCSPRATLYRRCGAWVSDWTLSSGEFILWSAESTLCLAWWSHCSEIPTSKIWLQGFCCFWAPCVELSSDRNKTIM